MFLNGHGGKIPAIESVSVEVNKRGGIAAMFSWYSIASAMNPDWAGGHAGAQEMSALMYACPEAVDTSAVQPSPLIPVSDTLPASGLSTVRFKGADVPV